MKSFASYVLADVPPESLRCDTGFFSLMGKDSTRLSFFQAFVRMMQKSDPEFRIRHVLNPTSDVLLDIARDALSPADPTRLSALPRKERDQQLMRLRDTGFTLRQIERLTGIGKSTIVDATRVYAPSPVQKEPSPMDG